MNRMFFPGYSIGTDAFEDIKNVCPRFGTKIAVVGGKQALNAAKQGIIDAVKGTEMELTSFLWYGGEASFENIERLKAEPSVKNADMLFAVGGGKAIDTCKALAQQTDKPFFTFPTIASTCASFTSLGILYHPDGSLREYSFSKVPPQHIFINSQIIADAPRQYLWAGIGDTMAKHYECTISGRGNQMSHSNAIGSAISVMCANPLVKNGAKALSDCDRHVVSSELEEVILGIIVSTGFVSNFVVIDYNTGMAHAVYNGFTILPAIEKNHHLHGEVVAYGILVCLMADGQIDEMKKIFSFHKQINFPTKLADIHATVADIDSVVEKALKGIDLRHYPYVTTADMIKNAILKLEKHNEECI